MNKKIYIVAALAVIVAGVFALRVSNQPPAQAPSAQKAAPQGAPMVAVKPADLTGIEVTGQTAFNAKCASCHGENGAGTSGVAPPLIHKYYEPSHHGDQAFHLAVQNGVRAHHWKFGDMPPVEGLTSADVDGIIAYVRAVQRANGIN